MSDEDLMRSILGEITSPGKPVVGGGGNTRRMVVDDGGIGLGQIDNFKAESDYVDEVDKYLIDKAKGMQAAGGDEFYGRIAMKQNAHAALNEEAAFKRINPVSVLDGILGNQVTLTHGQEKIAARWDGKDAETLPVTITISPVESPTTTGTPLFRPYAIIQWGTSGFLVSARIDVGRGTQLTVNASTVIVTLGLSCSNDMAATMKLTGMISFYPCVRTRKITCTQWFSVGASLPVEEDIIIPAFAKNVQVYRSDASCEIALSFINYGGVVITYLTRPAAAGALAETPMDPMPIPGDVIFLGATNNTASPCELVFIYELAL